MDTREKGFTLVETLFVLMVFLVISSISIMYAKPQYYTIERQFFLSQLQSDLFFAQQYAISHQKQVSVNIMADKNYYYIREQYAGEVLIERKFSEAIKLKEGSLPLFFQFSADGNVNRFGSFYIMTGGDTYRMTVLIGKGRFYVTKE